jgi:type II secretory pathway pseudopilin PulG
MLTVLIISILAAAIIPLMRGRVESARWSEGKAIMGTIAVSIRAYAAEHGDFGSYGVDLPSITELGFFASEFTGTYFTASNFTWTTSFDHAADPPLTFTITADNTGTGIHTPTQITLDHTGKWIVTP